MKNVDFVSCEFTEFVISSNTMFLNWQKTCAHFWKELDLVYTGLNPVLTLLLFSCACFGKLLKLYELEFL